MGNMHWVFGYVYVLVVRRYMYIERELVALD